MIFNKLYALFYFLLFSIGVLSAQTKTLSGIIKDAHTQEALIGANIIVEKPYLGVTTDVNGHFKIDIPLKIQKINISYIGYANKEIVLEKDSILEILLEPETQMTSEVVITGTMKEVQRSQSAVPIEVFTPKFFLKNPTPSLFEALANVNGVRPQLQCSVCNTGDIHINGMEGAYTMVMIDGMPIVSGLSTVYGLMGIPNSMVERIEVIKGPSSTLYGSEAVGGLINVITKTVDKTPKLYFDIFGTTDQELNTDFSTKWQKGNVSSLFSGNYFQLLNRFDRNNDNFTDVTNAQRLSFFNKWTVTRPENRRFDMGLRYVYEDRFGGEMQWEKAKHYGGDVVYGEHIATKRLEVLGKYDLPTKKPYTLQFSYNKHDQVSVYGTTHFDAVQDIGFLQLTHPLSIGKSDWLFGAALRYIYFDDNTIVTADTKNGANAPSKTWLPGVFVQNEVNFNAKNKLLMGLRYDYNTQNGSIFSPRLNYKWSPNSNNTVRVGFGNGYRVVNVFSEEHAAITGSRVVILAENLKPEQSYNVNINYVTKFFPKFGFIGFDASVFYTRFTNKIIADYDTDPNQIIFDNLEGFGISKGANLNLDFNFENGIKLVAGATYMSVFSVERGINLDKKTKIQQIQTPNFTANWALTYTFPQSKWTIDLTGASYSPMRLPILPNDFRPEYSPWFSVLNIQVSKPFKQGLEIYGGIKNVLNFVPKDPIMRPFDPFDKALDTDNPNGYTFDTNYNYAPMQGIRGFLGVRVKL